MDYKELPDYYLGCLIYRDDVSDDNMRWIVYDGRTYTRCISRKAAEHYAAQIRNQTNEEEIAILMQAHHFLSRAYRTLDKAASMSTIETRLLLERKALEVRMIADTIDATIAQKIPQNQDK